ncbi:MAG: helical backbone metal receptor [Gemmatimonadales bacterium]|nr:helical backbone metal receptor [Gemmatimonadales bacterium]
MVPRLLFAAALVAACGRASVRSPAAITLVDDAGVTTVLAAPARRIVSLIPAGTEILFALGADSAVVGRTRWCDWPAAAAQVPSVGDGMAPSVEAVAARTPDLVVAYRSPGNSGAIGRLRDLGIPVVEVTLDRQRDFDRVTRLLATALGRVDAGERLVASVTEDLRRAAVTGDRPPSVFVLSWSDPPIAIGGGSFLSEIVAWAGGRNVFGDVDQPSFTVSIEAVVARDPDYVLVVGADDPAFANRPEWAVVPAVRERRFLRVDGSEFNRPSPRIGAAVRTLAATIAAGGR